MATIVVGGSEKNVGKTALVCAVITALPEFAWAAVKITGHDYGLATMAESSRNEPAPGQQTDTARYLAAGAHRASLITRCGDTLPLDEIRRALGNDRNVIFESNRIVDMLKPDLCLALVGANVPKPSFANLLRVADAAVRVSGDFGSLPSTLRQFRLQSLDRLSPEITDWLRLRLGSSP